MKILSFERDGTAGYGVVSGDGVIDLTSRIGAEYPTLRALLAAEALGEAESAAAGAAADFGLNDITFLPLIPEPRKIICVGLNYHAHIEETGNRPQDHPLLFVRFFDSQVGHLQPLVKPSNSDNFDYEGELAVIIGRHARHVSEADALSHVAGYSIYNDGSVRDWQRHTTQYTPGKNFPGSGGFGPWMVTSDEIPDPAKLSLTTRLNGAVMQQATTDMMIFNVPYLISYISEFINLEPSDVIVTGTPSGVGMGRKPPVYMKAGDELEIEISGIGTLRHPVINEK